MRPDMELVQVKEVTDEAACVQLLQQYISKCVQVYFPPCLE